MYEDVEEYTPYQKLWNNVVWSFPLFSYKANSLLSFLGPATTKGDRHDSSPGPMEYWLKKLPSGASVVLQHPIGHPKEEDFLMVYSEHTDIDKLISELGFDLEVDWRADSNKECWPRVLEHFKSVYSWSLMRLDDNDNEFVIKSGLSESGAKAEANYFEKKGHKQTYWAEKR